MRFQWHRKRQRLMYSKVKNVGYKSNISADYSFQTFLIPYNLMNGARNIIMRIFDLCHHSYNLR